MRIDCCKPQAATGVYPLNELRVPCHCMYCGTATTPFIDPQRDNVERIAASYNLDYAVADKLYKAFRLTKYVNFSTFLAAIKSGTDVNRMQATHSYYSSKVIRLENSSALAVSVSCRDCLTTFRVVRTIPTVQAPATFCMICGSKNITSFTDENATYLETIAASYDTDVETIKAVLEVFGGTGITHFNEFVESYAGIKILGPLCKAYLSVGKQSFGSFTNYMLYIKETVLK